LTIKRRSEAQKGHLLLCLSGKKSIAILGIRHKSSVKTKEYINKRSVKTYEHGACAARTRTSVNPTPIAAQPLVQRTRLKFLISHNPRGNTVITLKSKSVSHIL
jgi:hypothetical protein